MAPWPSARCWPGSASASATASGSATPRSGSRPCWCASPTGSAACSALGPRLLIERDTLDAAQVLLPGRARPLRVQAGPAARASTPTAFVAGLQRALARRRLAGAQPARRAAAGHPRHRPPGDLPDAGRPDGAAHRRPRHRADDRDPPRPPHRHHRHPEMPGRQRRRRCSRSTWSRSCCWPALGVAPGPGAGPAAAAGDAAGAGGRAADLARSRRLRRPVAARRAGRDAHHVRVRAVAAGDRPRDLAGAPVPVAGGAVAALAAPRAISLLLALAVAAAGGAGHRRRAAADDRRLVRADRGRGGAAALGPHPAGLLGARRVAASRRLRAAPGDRQPAPAGLAVAARDHGPGCRRDRAGRGGGARDQPAQRGGPAPADPGAGPLSDRRPAGAAGGR